MGTPRGLLCLPDRTHCQYLLQAFSSGGPCEAFRLEVSTLITCLTPEVVDLPLSDNEPAGLILNLGREILKSRTYSKRINKRQRSHLQSDLFDEIILYKIIQIYFLKVNDNRSPHTHTPPHPTPPPHTHTTC